MKLIRVPGGFRGFAPGSVPVPGPVPGPVPVPKGTKAQKEQK